jgi:dihydrofolate reductase
VAVGGLGPGIGGPACLAILSPPMISGRSFAAPAVADSLDDGPLSRRNRPASEASSGEAPHLGYESGAAHDVTNIVACRCHPSNHPAQEMSNQLSISVHPFVSRANHPSEPALAGPGGDSLWSQVHGLCQEAAMRKMIGAMKISIDGRTEGPEGYADWVDAWSDDFGLTPQIDACVLGGGMYSNYEQYWAAIQEAPDEPNPMGSGIPTKAEVEWARFAAATPHYVLSRTLTSAKWPQTTILRGLDEIEALKRERSGKDIYLMGGAEILRACLKTGLVDELRFIVHPLIAGAGTPLFTAPERHGLELHHAGALSDGRVSLVYGIV